jgi:hypothetical protein
LALLASVSRLAGQSAPSQNGFYSVTPCRAVDTRNANGPWGGPAIAANSDRSFQLAGRCGVGSNAEAVAVNLTVTDPTSGGDIRVYPSGYPLSPTTAVNFKAGAVRANNGNYALGNGSLTVHVDQASGSANVIIDVVGYYETAATPPPPTPTPTPTPPPSGSGPHVWSVDFGGTNAGGDTATPSGIAVDSSGSVVVVGCFKGNVNFGGVTLSSTGLNDIYLVKFAATGSLQWAKRFGGTADDRAKGVAIDSGNNIYITGYFRNTVDFGGGALTGSSNAFLAKYTTTGSHIWSKRLSSTTSGMDEGTALGVDGGGNAIVATEIYSTSDFGGGALTSAGGGDIVLVKYSSTGAHVWSRRFGGSADDIATGVAVDQTTGEAWATGYFGGTVDFGGGNLTSAGGTDIFAVKYSSTGSHVWSRRWGSTSDDKGFGIAVDQAGSMVATGVFINSVDFGAGPVANSAGGDIFLAKYSAAGICQWSKGFGSTTSLSNESGYGVAFDPSGNVLLTGGVVSTVNFGGGSTTGDGWYNAFIAKFTGSGGYVWAKRYPNGTGHSNGRAIESDGAGNALATGDFEVAINLGGGTLTSPGAQDTYLVKLGP